MRHPEPAQARRRSPETLRERIPAAEILNRVASYNDKPLWLAAQGFPGIAAILPVLISEGYRKSKLPLQRFMK